MHAPATQPSLALYSRHLQVKKMLLAHVRSCQNRHCHTCHELRERIRARLVEAAAVFTKKS